jgi:hypothetical protein
MLVLLKKSFCLSAFLALILLLGGINSSSEINHSFSHKYESSFADIEKDDIAFFVNINQATNFNHLTQTTVDYVWVTLLMVFLVCSVNHQWYKPVALAPPWYLVLKHCSRIIVSGWKVSNLQYKAQLTYQH